MWNVLIVCILLSLLYPGSKIEDYRIRWYELPWWILVTLGLGVSCFGLFYSNDDRIILAGCSILFIAKLYSLWDHKNWNSEESINPKKS